MQKFIIKVRVQYRVHLGTHYSGPCTLSISNLLCNSLLEQSAAPALHLADRDDSKVTQFQEMIAQVPKS